MFDKLDMSQMAKMFEKAQQEAQKLQDDLESNIEHKSVAPIKSFP